MGYGEEPGGGGLYERALIRMLSLAFRRDESGLPGRIQIEGKMEAHL